MSTEPKNGQPESSHVQKFRVGVDVGGAFTDIVARKLASAPDDYSRPVYDGHKKGRAV
ncbi:MAG: hypothetical protein IIA92_11575 [Chloroflexi bacterium]|nr:hypothetical protein [Chloroflexota bacterium]